MVDNGGDIHVQTTSSNNAENEITTNGITSPSGLRQTDQDALQISMSESMSESQHEAASPSSNREQLGRHKESVASSLNGLDDSTATAPATSQKQSSAAAKLESRSKEELIQLIRKQLGLLKEARRAATESKNEIDTLRQQVSDFESRSQPKNSESMLALELSDYKRGMETLRKKCESADKELFESTGLVKELSIKMHNLTEQNAELQTSLSRQNQQLTESSNKITELNNQLVESQEEFERERGDLETKLEAALHEVEEMRESTKKARKELKNVLNQGADHKSELNQLHKAKEVLQKNYEDLFAEFVAYKEKAEFVLKQNRAEQQRSSESFEMEELQRQLKQKHEQINQLNENSLALRHEINSTNDRCRVLRVELEDARQSLAMAQKEIVEERRRLTTDYEQRIRHLAKELEDTKREILLVREQATNERQKQDEIHSRVTAELNASIQELQQRLKQVQLNADRSAPSSSDSKQRSAEREQKRSTPVNPINFNTETRFKFDNRSDTTTNLASPRDEMLNSLSDLLNEPTPESVFHASAQRSQSRSSVNSWTEPEDLEAQLEHTRDVLHETEQLNAKLEAQVDFLKKELRRIQSDIESSQHINKNMGYFKNVMLKFLAPQKANDDVRVQMLPVLATMLALTPEEIKSVEAALKAQQQEPMPADWAGYFGPLSGIF